MKRVWIVAAIFSVVTAVSAVRADSYQDLLKYKYGESRAAVADIEGQMKGATVESSVAIETKLLEVLQSAEATTDAKEIACRSLRQVGSAKCVPALAVLLGDEKLSHMARWALQGNTSPEAGAALRNALATVKGNLLVGVISSVGARRDAVAVDALAKLAKDADASVAGAALLALGHVGNGAAAKALDAAAATGALQKIWAEAYLECANRLATEDAAGAAKILRRLYENTELNSATRVGAFTGLVRGGGLSAGEFVAALKSADAKWQVVAAQLVGEQKDAGTVKACLNVLPSLTPNVQLILISGAMGGGNKAALPAAVGLVDSQNAEVSEMAIRAIGVLGDESHVGTLIRLAQGSDEKASAALASLTRLQGEKVGGALQKLLKSSNPGERAKSLEVIGARSDRSLTKAVLAACRDEDKQVRLAAYKALRFLANENSLGDLADVLIATKSDGERSELEQTMIGAALRGQNADAVSALVIVKLGKSADADANLLNVLAKRGGAAAFSAVRKTFATGNADQKKAAVRAMSVWADTTPLKDLLSIAQTDADAANRALALRGYVRLVAEAGGSADEKVKMYKAALDVTKQADAIKQVLGGLGEMKDIGALKLAAEYLGNAEVVNEAASAVLNGSRSLTGGRRGSRDKAIADALEKVATSQANEGLRKQAEEILSKFPNKEKKK